MSGHSCIQQAVDTYYVAETASYLKAITATQTGFCFILSTYFILSWFLKKNIII